MQFYYRYLFENRWSRSWDINEKPFRTKHVFINISQTASLIFKRTTPLRLHWWDLSIDTLNLKIGGAVLEILMKNHFVWNMFSLISQERLHQFSSLRCLWIRLIKPNLLVLAFWKSMQPFTRYLWKTISYETCFN